MAFGDKGESYARAWARTQKTTIAVEFVEQLMEQGKCQSYTEAIDAIKEEFGDKGEKYAEAFERGVPGEMYMNLMVRLFISSDCAFPDVFLLKCTFVSCYLPHRVRIHHRINALSLSYIMLYIPFTTSK